MQNVAERIKAEHRNIAKVLKALGNVVDRLQDGRQGEDLRCLFDICQYVRVFPDSVHHPKEDACIFGPLREQAPQHAALLDDVHAQHAQCGALTDELYAAAKSFDAGTLPAAELKAVSDRYLAFQFEHMRLEEDKILPLAEQPLDPSVWSRANDAFAGHADPLFGDNLEVGFNVLHRRIVKGT